MPRPPPEVGPALFFSLLIITLSFVPVFTWRRRKGVCLRRWSSPKTYAMAAAAGLSVTLVLECSWATGSAAASLRKPANPVNRLLIAMYRPRWTGAGRFPKRGCRSSDYQACLWPLARLGGEFVPALGRGRPEDAFCVAGAVCGQGRTAATDGSSSIKTVPEVAGVYGKTGRAEKAQPIRADGNVWERHPVRSRANNGVPA